MQKFLVEGFNHITDPRGANIWLKKGLPGSTQNLTSMKKNSVTGFRLSLGTKGKKNHIRNGRKDKVIAELDLRVSEWTSFQLRLKLKMALPDASSGITDVRLW